MSLVRQGILGMAVIAASAVAVPAAIYNDAIGENFDGNAHMDISSVEVTSDGTNITFKISVSAASINSPDWGKYVIAIDTSNATGDATSPVGNPWGRNITMADKADAWIGSWVDGGGGFQPWSYSGASWTQNGSGAVVISGNSTTITTSLASLGLTNNQTIAFDVYTTGGGGGDSANDAAANAAQSTTGWSGPYTTASDSGLVFAIPEPGALGVLGGLAGLAMLRRRRTA